jgi:hypothetical protein
MDCIFSLNNLMFIDYFDRLDKGLLSFCWIHEGDPDEAEHRFNWETHSSSAGVAGMLLHIYGKFTTWTLKISLFRTVSFKLWNKSGSICDIWSLLASNFSLLMRTIARLLFFHCRWPLSFSMLVLVTQMLSSYFPYTYMVSHCHCI